MYNHLEEICPCTPDNVTDPMIPISISYIGLFQAKSCKNMGAHHKGDWPAGPPTTITLEIYKVEENFILNQLFYSIVMKKPVDDTILVFPWHVQKLAPFGYHGWHCSKTKFAFEFELQTNITEMGPWSQRMQNILIMGTGHKTALLASHPPDMTSANVAFLNK